MGKVEEAAKEFSKSGKGGVTSDSFIAGAHYILDEARKIVFPVDDCGDVVLIKELEAMFGEDSKK